jgi:PAS domain S-box-containing protein
MIHSDEILRLAEELAREPGGLSSEGPAELSPEDVRRAHHELRVIEKSFLGVLHASQDAIFLIEGRTIVDCNEATAKMFGYTHKNRFLRMHPAELSPPQQADGKGSFEKANEMIEAAFTKGYHRFEWMHRRASGEDFPVEVSLTPVVLGGKHVLHCVCRDISEVKRTEAALHASEEHNRAQEALSHKHQVDAFYARQLIEASPDPLATINADGTITDVNVATERITGQSRQRLIGSNFADYFTEPERARAGYGEVLAQGHIIDYPLTFLHPPGTGTEVLYNASVYRNEQGRVLGVLASGRDITERKRTEEKIKRQGSLIESLLDSIPDIIFFKNCDGVYLGCNPPFAEFVGRSRDEIIGRTDFDLFGREVAESFLQHDQSMLESGQSRHNEEWITYPDGRRILIDTLKTPYRSLDGSLLGVLGISRDITARKRGEEELLRSTERLALATRAGGVGIWDYDVVNNCLVWDEQMFRLYGITRDQFGGAYEAWQAGLHPDDRQRGDAEIQLALRAEKEFDIEFRVLWPDGTTRNIRGFALVERDAAGHPLRMIGTNWDITDQKRTAEALLESEANFRTFFETMTDMILVGTPEGRILFANAAVTRMLGYTPDELKGMHLLDTHPAGRRQEAGEIFGAMFRGERESCPLPLARKDGGLVPVETRVWFGKWNGANCLFGICKNLSEEQEAKQRFERLFRSNPNAMGLSSLADGKFVDVNDAFLKTLGYARAEVLGKTSAELGLFLHPQRHAAAATQLQLDGHIADCELQVRRRDGAILDGLFSGELISSQGRMFLLTVMIDITARKRVEVELARLSVIQRELMHLATNFVNVPLERQDAAIDQSLATMGRLIDADRAYLFAYDFAAGIMWNTHEWCAAGIAPEIENLQALPNAMLPDWVDAHLRGALVHIPSVAALPADGYLRQVLEPQGICSLITLPLMQGDVCLGFVGFDAVREERTWRDEDVALLRVLAELYSHFEARRGAERESLELQQNLIEARDAAQAAGQAKSLFLANMSHEIRTPLNAVLGYAQIMERECRHCPGGGRMKAITRSGEHLLELLTDLLELVRNDARATTLTLSDFDFHQLLEDVRLMFAPIPLVQGMTLEVSLAPDVPRFIHCDAGKVRQILVNLVGNAVKFTTAGGVHLSASVLSCALPDGVLMAVDVEDTGSGVGQDELEQIFDVFEQAQQGRKSGKGTGLGLPLSRRYARALGGDVTVSSRVGMGSCFRLTFDAQVVNGWEQVRSQQGCVLRLAAEHAACRLLVVDDDPDNREMLSVMLAAVGFSVEVASSAAQALQRLRGAVRVDVVLMDKCLPEMDGYEAIGRLREIPGGRELPVLVVTASGCADEASLALAAGANGFVPKPVRREQLLAEIGRVAGVCYHHEAAPAAAANALAPTVAEPATLAHLPAEQRLLFDQALHRGDIRLLRALIAGIPCAQAGLAAALGGLVDSYDYDRIRQVLDLVKENDL